ncbi:hypothetical protein [Streptomyces gossypii]|uniref:hypothetical protein n=1 Tax=Streptomyces gossypii TaxID=2883101 RepID=UPI0035CCFEB3
MAGLAGESDAEVILTGGPDAFPVLRFRQHRLLAVESANRPGRSPAPSKPAGMTIPAGPLRLRSGLSHRSCGPSPAQRRGTRRRPR